VYAAFGRQQLDQAPTHEYLQEWAAILAREQGRIDKKRQSAFIFRAGSEWMALPARIIQEVVDMGIIHSLPHRRSKVLRGLVSIRGKLELCFAIGALLGIERVEKKEANAQYVSPERLIVAEHKQQRIVFPVSQVYGIIKFSTNMLQQLPITVSGSKAAFTRGIICINKDFDAGLLETDILFEALTRSLL
jgi:chemotaxis-related protein WspD